MIPKKQTGILSAIRATREGLHVVEEIVPDIVFVKGNAAIQIGHHLAKGILTARSMDIARKNRRLVVKEPLIDGILHEERIVLGIGNAAPLEIIMMRLEMLGRLTKVFRQKIKRLRTTRVNLKRLVHPSFHLPLVFKCLIAFPQLIMGIPHLFIPAPHGNPLLVIGDRIVMS